MDYQGRVITVLFVLVINLIYMGYYFVRDGYISLIEVFGLPILLMLAWWFGRQYDRAKYYSEKDALTGIYNRRFIENFFSKMKTTADRNHQEVAVLFIDVNNFKAINDHLGHKEGDNLLRLISKQLADCIGDRDIVARWGGDEFIILSPGIMKNNNHLIMMAQIHGRLKQLSSAYSEISVSVGTAVYPIEGENLDGLLKVADKKMYNMKIRHKA